MNSALDQQKKNNELIMHICRVVRFAFRLNHSTAAKQRTRTELAPAIEPMSSPARTNPWLSLLRSLARCTEHVLGDTPAKLKETWQHPDLQLVEFLGR